MNRFNIERTIQDIKGLAFPRFVGSEGEKEAADYIKKEFEKTGLKVTEEDFTYSILSFKVFRKIGHLLQAILILTAAYLLRFSPVLSIILSIFLFTFLCFSTRWTKFLSSYKSIGKKKSSRNIVASNQNPDAEKKIIVMAHYDTKSQFLPMRLRIPTLILSIFGGIIFSLTIIGISISAEFLAFSIPYSYFWYFGLFLSVITVLLIFNRTRNGSPGVIDNASGVAIMLELAREVSDNLSKKLDIEFVATSAEEIGLKGAASFLKNHKKELKNENVFLVNLDALGSGELKYNSGYGFPTKRTSRYINGLIKETAEEQDIKINSKYVLTGLAADHMPFVENGFEATWLRSSLSTVHTDGDNLDRINKDNLENAGVIVQELIYRIGED